MPAARNTPGLHARAQASAALATLPTMFRLGHSYKHDERFGVVGDCEQLGVWKKAVPMKVGGC
jgi:hypothetical protein